MVKEDLEKKAWYRLAKVVYLGTYFIAILFVGLLAYSQKPQLVADANKSEIVCSNNKRYDAEKAGIFSFELTAIDFRNRLKSIDLSSQNKVTFQGNDLNESVREKAVKVCLSSFMNDIPNFVAERDANGNQILRDTKTGAILSTDRQWYWNPQLDDWEPIKGAEIVTNSNLFTENSKEYQQAKQFSIDVSYHTQGGWGKVTQWALVGFALTSLAFEFIRKIFLYVTIGNHE